MAKSDRISASKIRAKLDAIMEETGYTRSGLRGLLKPKSAGGKKGSPFERKIAQQLGMWWSGRDDVFWRTGGSGGRATVRHRAGQATAQQHGDIGTIDADGAGLTNLLTIECKKGYNDATIANLFDAPRTNKNPTTLEDFFLQAERSRLAAFTYAWIVIHARDGRQPVVWMPAYFFDDIDAYATFADFPNVIRANVGMVLYPDPVVGVLLEDFLGNVARADCERIYKGWQNDEH